MRVRLDYGSDGLDVDLPDERVTVIEPAFRAGVEDPHAALLKALRAPTGRPALRDVVTRGQSIAISVCDITRAQPRREMLRALFEELPHIADDDVTILIATGTHRANTAAELERMLGADILRRFRVVNHDSRDAGSLGFAGTHHHRCAGLPESSVARRGRPYHDRIRRAAFLCRLQRRSEDGGAGTGRSRDRPGPAQRSTDRTSPGHVGRDAWQPGARRRPRNRRDDGGALLD